MKLNNLILITAMAAASVAGNFASAQTVGTFQNPGNNNLSYTSYSPSYVFADYASPTLTGSFDYTFTFNLASNLAFTTVVNGWDGMTGMSGTLTPSGGSALNLSSIPLSGGGTSLSYGSLSGASQYSLHFVGTAPEAGQSFNVQLHSVQAVPEPETFAMLLAGLGLIGMVTRRRSQVAAA